MTRLYLDTEFNGLGGSLISMALVADDGDNWYEVYAIPRLCPDPWVAEHVLPVLGKEPIGAEEFRRSLDKFLRRHDGCEIVADWPDDFTHLADQMGRIGAAYGFEMPIRCTMRLIDTPELSPAVPHNALSDAIALWAYASVALKPWRPMSSAPDDGRKIFVTLQSLRSKRRAFKGVRFKEGKWWSTLITATIEDLGYHPEPLCWRPETEADRPFEGEMEE